MNYNYYHPYRTSDYFDDDYDYYNRQQNELRRQQQLIDYEAALRRRQAQVEHEQEMKRQRRRRQQELARQQSKEELELQRRSRNFNGADDSFRLVRGPGGYLYKVPIRPRSREQTSVSHRGSDSTILPNSPPHHRMGRRGNFYRENSPAFRNANEYRQEADDDEVLEASCFEENISPARNSNMYTPHETRNEVKQNSNTLEILGSESSAVIVEDASDSENEDDELNSVWRNRKPSTGESWMEPIA